MADRDRLFSEVIAPLQEVRQTLSPELERLSRAPYLDTRALVVLDRTLLQYAAQADALVAIMVETRASGELVDVAKDLVTFFASARKQITSMLVVGRG